MFIHGVGLDSVLNTLIRQRFPMGEQARQEVVLRFHLLEMLWLLHMTQLLILLCILGLHLVLEQNTQIRPHFQLALAPESPFPPPVTQ
jgi:hypothetical protein